MQLCVVLWEKIKKLTQESVFYFLICPVVRFVCNRYTLAGLSGKEHALQWVYMRGFV